MRGARWAWALVCGLAAVMAVGGVAVAADGLPGLRTTEAPLPQKPSAYMIQLEGAPAIQAVTAAQEDGLTARQAETRGSARLARNEANQDRVATQAEAADLIEGELFRVGTAYNGIAVIAEESDLEELAALPGVKAVLALPEHERNNDVSVPYIGGPTAWATSPTGSPGQKLTGAGIKIGIIDTGVDYVHKNFGGPGTPGALNAARSPANNVQSTTTPVGFQVSDGGTVLYPSAKVVGGFDLAGDSYNAGSPGTSIPQPDPNPMDCPSSLGGGHGSHVAGSAAGLGVNQAGNTFTGDYSTLGTSPVNFRIGPGVAPKADIYSIRVFGCTGSTNLAVQAIDWALDPNGDGNTSDRLDVVNLSLGSPFEVAEDPMLVAAQNAVEAGLVVVGSAGNSGNQTFQLGGAGAAPGAISVANSIAAYRTDNLILQSPRPAQPGTFSVAYPWASMSSPVTGQLVRPSTNPYGCSTYTSGEAAAIAGKVVMVDWRPSLGQDFPCGSAVRANNAAAAGAVGIVMADVEPTYTSAITGNAAIPAIYVIKTARQYLIDQLNNGPFTVTFDAAQANAAASMELADTVSSSSSRGPRGGGGALKPDIAAPGTTILSTDAGSGSGGRILSGTSMAAPHVAGAMAVLRQAKPVASGWSVEHLKALAMNTADAGIYTAPGHSGDREGPQRVGAGRIDLGAALNSDAVALAKSDLGEVSVSFGPLQIPVDGGPFSAERQIEVFNHGSASVTYNVAFDSIGAPAGVNWSFPDGNSVTVPAGGRSAFRLRLAVPNPAALRHRKEASMPATQNTYRRWWLSEASGAVTLTATGEPTLRVPAYASLRPAGTLKPARTIRLDGTGDQTGTLALTGANADTGGTAVDHYSSITAGFELQARSPRLVDRSGALASADIRHVGVAYDDDLIYFAIGAWGPNPAPGSFAAFDIYIDSDRDGDDDFIVYNVRLGPNGVFTDSFTTGFYVASTDSAYYYNAPLINPVFGQGYWGTFDSDVIAIPIPPDEIGLSPFNSRFNYRVESSLNGVSGAEDAAPEPNGATARYLTWDFLNPGISFDTLFDQGNVSELSYQYKADQFAANESLGALLFQYLNASGNQSQSVEIEEETPPVVDVGGPYRADEGRPLLLDARGSSDPNGDELTIDWDLDGNGTYEQTGATASVTYDDGPSSRRVGLRVTDGNTPPIERQVEIEVVNVAPVVETTLGGDRQLFIQASDPSDADRAAGFKIEIDKDGNGVIDQVYEESAGVSTPLPLVEAPGTWRITATDKDGAISQPVSVPLPVVAAKPPGAKKAAKRCRVPKLRGKSLAAARKALRKASCRLGKVRRAKKGSKVRQGGKVVRGRYVVRSQSVKPRATRKAGTKVAVRLAFKPKRGSKAKRVRR